MRRYLQDAIQKDIDNKIVMISGPRQTGKTTLAKMLDFEHDYFNYDLAEHRVQLNEKSWNRDKELIIFDELHKMSDWKRWLKGVFDVEGVPPRLLVTGSSNLSTFRKTGDSLAGRHFSFRLHPIDLHEALMATKLSEEETIERLFTCGGFPEPFLKGKKTFYNRWRRSHIDLILKEDLLTLSLVRDLQSIETLIELLRGRVGSSVSANSLANDLQKSPKTVMNWLTLLENLFVIFKISPHHKNVARSLLKEPKYYFYDNAFVVGDDGVKFENLVANSLYKYTHYQQDVNGEDIKLSYVRDQRW